MLSRNELRLIARTRLRDAEVLFRGKRYQGAVYLCGYAVELILKRRICITLRWPGFPSTNAEFRDLQSFKTHNFNVLIRLSGRMAVTTSHVSEWSVVSNWDPELRYKLPNTVTRADARAMIEATRKLMRVL